MMVLQRWKTETIITVNNQQLEEQGRSYRDMNLMTASQTNYPRKPICQVGTLN